MKKIDDSAGSGAGVGAGVAFGVVLNNYVGLLRIRYYWEEKENEREV